MPSPLASAKNPAPYWEKREKLNLENLEWNIPEQPSGSLTLIGGNAQHFALPIKIGEFLGKNYPIKDLKLLFPDALASTLPKDPRFVFAPSTPSGSLANSEIIQNTIATSDATLILGDLTRNLVTAQAIIEAIKTAGVTDVGERPEIASAISEREPVAGRTPAILLTRDSVDSLAAPLISHPRLILVATLAQLQKLFRELYYPKVLLLSMPILPVVEALHKFTLSYPTEILTFHDGFILSAKAGKVISLPISATDYSPLSLWQGELAAKYLALTLYNIDILA